MDLSTSPASIIANTTRKQTVDNTVLVFARDTGSAYSAYSGLQAYGIPYQVVVVPQSGITLPQLNSSTTHGNYGGIVMMSEVSYDYSGSWHSAITSDQFTTIYNYQATFGVRMVRIDVYPEPSFGCQTAIASTGCCGDGVEQYVSFTNATGFPTANIKTGATQSTKNMWHYPATIIDPSTTWQIAKFAPDSNGQFTSDTTAAVINSFDGRQQMVWFASWATDWSATSNFLQHSYIHWMTRGLFLGARKVYLSTQVDDVHLSTDLYSPSGNTFRLRTADLTAHVNWMKSINSRLPAGSKYVVELCHNGNGDIITATNTPQNTCKPEDAIYYDERADPPLEFQKPVGTGTSLWPTTPRTYSWSLACAKFDKLASWFTNAANRDAFFHVSHTFSHENLNNATYSDTSKEITFNQAWLKQIGISAGKFSPHGLVPPAITGLHNGDAIKAWMDNGITKVVGDNSRPLLVNQNNRHWPQISTVATNGYNGLTIMPRWSTAMYYNCDLPDCTSKEWIATSGGYGDFSSLVEFEKTTTSRYLLGLRHDAYMFHQANLRAADVPSMVVGTQTGTFSLLQTWVEAVTQEMVRLTNWPMVTLQHDDLTQKFLDRMARDNCNPKLSYTYSSDGKSITGVTVTANGNTCSVPIPVTFPASATASGTATSDKLGSEPLIMWATLSGSPVSFSLSTPVRI